MTTKIVIDRIRLDTQKPAIVVLMENEVQYADEVVINGPCTVTGIASGKPPLGKARVWLETESEVTCNIY